MLEWLNNLNTKPTKISVHRKFKFLIKTILSFKDLLKHLLQLWDTLYSIKIVKASHQFHKIFTKKSHLSIWIHFRQDTLQISTR